ncbi:hypothetical protein UFOVP731_21 [uncultured Caudovirales phage]|uniref:Uncharacterized protein n=1 Tax=uncultured Caudovirales phage TaxID=2100421 RepID=A0A6J5NUB3_9CAUD|nr:hypothetical protein UFOVP731_21 [uncultured Caudovirales phage]
MSPEQIVEEAARLGILLYVQDGRLKYFGTRPEGWLEISKSWLEFRNDIIKYLESPLWTHRVRLAKAFAAKAKSTSGIPCKFLGILLELKPSCGCGPRHSCEKYGDCVLSGSGGGKWKVCSQCSDYIALGDS